MSKILILAESGFGKSTSLGQIKGLNIKGLDPKKTLIIACSDRDLPFPGWSLDYTKITTNSSGDVTGNYINTNEPGTIIKTIEYFLRNRSEIENYVIDDFNFIMQDYYMDNAKQKGYTVFQTIGYDLGQIFKALALIHKKGKNVIVLAHPETYEVNGITKYKMKTVGNMVDQYITPLAKFDIVLMGHETYEARTGKTEKFFVTGYDGNVRGKAPYGMFKDLYVPNDMYYILEKVDKYKTKI